MPRSLRFAILLAAFGCRFAVAAEEKIGVSVGSTGSTDSRPLSEGWLEYWLKAPMTPFADRTILQLASELTESKSVVSDSWSQRTEAEIHSAISSDNLLANNAWSTVRCSKNGCLVAIQSLDTKVYDRQRTYKGRLLAYLTPRVTNSNQLDLTTVESDRILVKGQSQNRLYIIFFVFPGKSTRNDVNSSEAEPESPKISTVIASQVRAAQEAVNKEQWIEAINQLEVAERTEKLTSFDRKTIGELKGYAYIKIRNYKLAEQAYVDSVVFALDYSQKDLIEDVRHVLYLSRLNGNYLKSIEMGRAMVDYSVAQSEDLALVSESYFALRDCKYAVIWADKSIASSKTRGESPRSSSLNVKSDCNRFFEAAKQHGDADKSIVAF